MLAVSLNKLANSLPGRLRWIYDTESVDLAAPEDARHQAPVEGTQNVDPEVVFEIPSDAELRYFKSCLRESYCWVKSSTRFGGRNKYHSK